MPPLKGRALDKPTPAESAGADAIERASQERVMPRHGA